MPRSQNLKDPVSHLKNLIVKRGESGHLWTFFNGANVVWDPREHAHSDTYQDAKDVLLDWADDPCYKSFIVNLTHRAGEDFYYPISEFSVFPFGTVYLHRDTAHNSLGVTFTLPYLDASEFDVDVEILSHISLFWAKIAHAEVTSLRAFINCAFLKWEDMEGDNLLFTEYESN